MNRTLLLAPLVLCLTALGQDQKSSGKLKGSSKQSAPKIDLGLPSFNSIPKGEELRRVEEKPQTDVPTTTAGVASYSIVNVQHGKSFIRTPQGSKPTAPFPAVMAEGNPLKTEKFSTIVRVKAPDKKTTSIDVVILDVRGDTVMEASGSVTFKNEETDWTVDWDPTGIRAPGDFQVLVRIGGNPMGSFPIKIELKK
jgi:hypothetical protein